ncbi:hypothetical protein M1N92_06320 [Dehalococcoidia bacterium]|nr:hypothetical protein [Dehalococcoidia bacterium]
MYNIFRDFVKGKEEKCIIIKERGVMGRIDIILPDELEERFRAEVAKQLGMRRGNLTLAIQEAIELWIETRYQDRSERAKKAWGKRKGGDKKEKEH